jgi:hypothetical protein
MPDLARLSIYDVSPDVDVEDVRPVLTIRQAAPHWYVTSAVYGFEFHGPVCRLVAFVDSCLKSGRTYRLTTNWGVGVPSPCDHTTTLAELERLLPLMQCIYCVDAISDMTSCPPATGTSTHI